jgi:L-lactate dehydrogenase complex protein LldG
MSSRDLILKKLAAAKRPASPLPEVTSFRLVNVDPKTKFIDTVRSIGSAVVELDTPGGINEYILQHFPSGSRNVSMVKTVKGESFVNMNQPHSFETVDLFVLEGHFGVAENGAVWLTSPLMGDRVLPFICQHLAIVLKKTDIVETLHQAYERIGDQYFDLGVFIAGPSKTADIEQSLVLGAHGPKTLTIFLL